MSLLSQKEYLIIACLIVLAMGTFAYKITKKLLVLLITLLITFIIVAFIVY